MASLIKQHDRYYAQFFDSARKPQRKRVALMTGDKRAATTRLRKLEYDYINGSFDPWTMDAFNYDKQNRVAEALTLHEAFLRFVDQKRRDGRKMDTLRTYEDVLGRFTRNVGPESLVASITEKEINTFVRAAGISKVTQHARFRNVKTFVRWCQKEEYLKTDPLRKVTAPEAPQKLPKAITRAELDLICKAMQNAHDGCHRRGEIIWMIPLFRFGFYTGMRSSELGRLRWRDIDFDKGLIYIRRQKNKKEQTIPLNTKAREVLDGIQTSEPNAYVFRSPRLDDQAERSTKRFRESVSRAFAKYKAEAKITRPLSFHSLRHGFATALAEAGKSAIVIKEACRHSDIKTSMLYVHMTSRHLREELDDVFC